MNRIISMLTLLALTLSTLAAGVPAAAESEGDARIFGNHVKLNFRMDGARMVPTAVFAVEDAAHDLVMLAFVDDDRLFVSDGVDRPYVLAFSFTVGRVWHRLDVVLHGDTYTIHFDQRQATTARTFVDASTGTWVADPRPLGPSPTYEAVDWTGHRADMSGMKYDTTFTVDTGGWETIGDATRIERQDGRGHHAPGQIEIRNAPLLDVAYLRAPTAGMGGTYSAETSLNLISNVLRMDGMAAFAGIAGDASDPSVQWMIEVGRPTSTLNQWALFLNVDGERTQLAPGWSTTGWHTLRAQVDETANRLTVHVDDHAPQTFDVPLGTSTHVAVGDVDAGAGIPHSSPIIYDDLALYQEAAP